MEKLGINPLSLAGQIINFLIIFFFLAKFVYKPFLKILKSQEEKEEERKKAEARIIKLKEEMETLKAKKMADARKEAGVIMAEAKENAVKRGQAIIAASQEQAGALIKAGQEKLATDKKQMEEKMRIESTELAVKIAGKLISRYLDEASHQKLNQETINSLKELMS